jgi:hypothetical protein
MAGGTICDGYGQGNRPVAATRHTVVVSGHVPFLAIDPSIFASRAAGARKSGQRKSPQPARTGAFFRKLRPFSEV